MASQYAPYTLAYPAPSEAWRLARTVEGLIRTLAQQKADLQEYEAIMVMANLERDGTLAQEAAKQVVRLRSDIRFTEDDITYYRAQHEKAYGRY